MRIFRTFSGILRAIYIPFIIALALLVLIGEPIDHWCVTSADIRSDCGDLRYTYLGLIHTYQKLPDPDRNALLLNAEISPTLKRRWIPIRVDFAHNPQSFIQMTYRVAAAWARTDPRIARFVVDDEIAALTTPHHPGSGLTPNLLIAIRCANSDSKGHFTITPGWKSWPPLQEYCGDHGYTP